MKSVCVLGNGQLGRMLRQAGEPLGIHVYPVGLDVDPTSIPYQNSVITAEIERWPETEFTKILASHSSFVNRDIFPIIADRLTQKQLFDSLHIPTAKWSVIETKQQWVTLFSELSKTVIAKRRVGGYDGRGQWRIDQNCIEQFPENAYQSACIAEAKIPFDCEMSLVGARNSEGKTVFYPLTHNLHQDGILKMSVAFPNVDRILQSKAEAMLGKILNELNYVGVMAMECFVIGNDLLVNELAPRVHNSGHWTQNGASISQFELHLRAILGLPMPTPTVFSSSVMINLIGTEYQEAWLSVPLTHLHWYEKEVRKGRKVGHLNLTHLEKQELSTALDQLVFLLPEEYISAINWAKEKLIA